MKTQSIKDSWSDFATTLKEQFQHLTDADLYFEEGKEKELFQRLQTKLGKTTDEILNLIVPGNLYKYFKNIISGMGIGETSETAEKGNTGKIVLALLAGAAIGTVLGVLFAPAKGSETRKRIANGAKNLSDTVMNKVEESKNTFAGLKDNLTKKVS